MSRYWSLLALLVTILGVFTFFYSANELKIWLPQDRSSHGRDIDSLFYFILVLTAVVFVATEGALFYFMWKYAAGSNTQPVKYTHGSHTLEIVWTIIPAATLLFIAIFQFNSWAQTKMRNPIYGADGMRGVNPATGVNDDMLPTVEVVARQWEWRVRYPGKDGLLGTQDDLFTVNELHVPANKDTVVLLKSNDILHSFFIPNMRVKQDAVPGMEIPVWFKPVKEDGESEYEVDIVCAEHCGPRHYAMKGRLYVHNQDEYDQYIRGLTKKQMATSNVTAAN